MISNQQSAVVTYIIYLSSKYGLVCLGHKRQRVMGIFQQGVFTVAQINHDLFNFHMQHKDKDSGLCPDITAVELLLGNR